MSTIYDGAKYLAEFLEGLLGEHFDRINGGNFKICIYKRPWKEGDQTKDADDWEDLCHGGQEKEHIERREKGRLVYERDCEKVQDSRMDAKEAFCCLKWMFFMKEQDELIRRFLEFSFEELFLRMNDMLLLENMDFLVDEKDKSVKLSESDAIKESAVGKYLFESLSDKETLVNRYCREFLARNELPDLMTLVQMSAMFYEKRTVRTRIYFCEDEEIEEQKMCVKFCKAQELAVNNLRSVRKLMEMSGEKHGLLVQKEGKAMQILGIVRDEQAGNPRKAIEFVEHMAWKVQIEGQEIFEYRNGICRLPCLENRDNREAQKERISTWLDKQKVDGQRIQCVIDFVEKVREKSTHGSSIVFMSEKVLQKEVERLCGYKKAYQITEVPCEMIGDEIVGITSVDGALLADLTGTCYAVGAILDGLSLVEGNPGRGARYNSVTNYLHVLQRIYEGESGFFAVIISEDESMDVKFLEDDKEKALSEFFSVVQE